MNIVFLGTPAHSAQFLTHLLESGVDVKAVVTNPDQPVGRHQELRASEVAQVAEKHHLTVFKPEIIDDQLVEELKKLEPDLFVVFAYGKILPVEFLNLPRLGSINLHGSLLPKYRGTAPIQAAIYVGDKETGVTIIQMNDKMDKGAILAQKAFPLTETDTFETVADKMAEVGSQLLLDILPTIETINPQPQNDSEASYTWKRAEMKQAAHFSMENLPSAEALDRMARAFYPWPGAWTEWNGKVVKIYPGKMIQIEGKKVVSFEEFKRGYPEFPEGII